MSKFKSFFKDNIKPVENTKVELDRFNDPIELRPLTPSQNEKIMDACRKTKAGTNGKQVEYMSQGKYIRLSIMEAIVIPDLEDKELQDSFGVRGKEALLDVLFTAEELGVLANAATPAETIDEASDEAKN